MTFNEELLDHDRFTRLNKRHQADIIAEYCKGVEEQIRTASSRSEAENISSSACLQFNKECSSTLVRNAMSRHVQEIIAKHWDQ